MNSQKLKELREIINKYRTVKVEESTPSFININAYKFTLGDGGTIKREKILKGKKDGSAAIIIPYIGNNILLVIEPRVFTKTGVGVGFPAGYIEEGEDPKTAALRELREETGLVPERIEEVDAFYQDEGCSSAYNHIFIAYNCKKEYEQDLDKDEYIRYMAFTEDEVRELEELGYINGCNSKLAIQKIKKIVR